MTSRERVSMVMSGEVPDRVPFHDSYWGTTIQRWRNEGLPGNISPDEYFGCEIARLGGDYSLQLPREIVEETERYRVYRDSNGATRKDLRTPDGWTPQWLDFSIKSRDDWNRLREHALYNPSRLSGNLVEVCSSMRAREKFITYSVHGCFHPTWNKIGMETLLIWMLDDPELVKDMFAAHTQLALDLYDGMKEMGVQFDGAWVSDDLGYRTAPLISPELYHRLVMPYHRALCEHFARDGLKTILHSDGNVEPLIPHFLEAGFTALHPLESKAGLDVRKLKPLYGGRLVFFGNIDVRKLAGSREEIEEEIRTKVTSAKQGGGYIYHSDHSVPSNVSFENYCFAVEMVKKYGN
jgi:uroporphyrinogen decarboxylase